VTQRQIWLLIQENSGRTHCWLQPRSHTGELIAKEARDAVANRGELVMAVIGAKRRWLCAFGFQAHRSRSVKTATTGCRHRDTYTNRRRQRTPGTNIERYGRPPMRRKKFLSHNVRKNNCVKSFVPFDLPPRFSSIFSVGSRILFSRP
jgi:hypothetical protein